MSAQMWFLQSSRAHGQAVGSMAVVPLANGKVATLTTEGPALFGQMLQMSDFLILGLYFKFQFHPQSQNQDFI